MIIVIQLGALDPVSRNHFRLKDSSETRVIITLLPNCPRSGGSQPVLAERETNPVVLPAAAVGCQLRCAATCSGSDCTRIRAADGQLPSHPLSRSPPPPSATTSSVRDLPSI